MANKPEMAAAIAATKMGPPASVVMLFPCLNGNRMTPPRITGSEAMNEYDAAKSLSRPTARALEIVRPDRDIPGKIAAA